MINERLIMNFVEEQEELSLSIWACLELGGWRRQAKGKRVGDCVERKRWSGSGGGCQGVRERKGELPMKMTGKGFWNS